MRVLLWQGRMGRVEGCLRRFAGCITDLLLGKMLGFGGEEGVWCAVITLIVDSEDSKLGQGCSRCQPPKSTVLRLRRSW